MTIKPPYGNVFLVDTPALDQLSNRLYQEERQREMLRYQENKNLDEEFSRNLAGIRDADIGLLTQKYGDFKQAYTNSLKKKGGVSPQEQLELLRKKADVYDVINKSKSLKERHLGIGKKILNDPKRLFADDAQQRMIALNRIPIDQYNEDAENDLMYKYSDPNFDKDLVAARGKLEPRELLVGQSKRDPMSDEFEVYGNVGSSPNTFFDNLFKGKVAKNTARGFAGLVNNNYDDDQFNDLQTKYYAKINDPKFKAIYGEVKPFPESAMKTELGRAAAIQTMEEYVNASLNPDKVISKVNIERQTKDRQKFAKEQQERAAKNSLARMYVYANIQDRKPESIERNIDGIIANHIESGRENNGEVLVDNETYKSITGQDKSGSSFLRVDENGNYTYGKKITGADGMVSEKVSGNIPLDAAKIKLTKTFKSGLDSRYNTGQKKIDVKNSTYTIKGKNYSEAELLKMGYTKEQIAPYKNK